jgi:glycosyltransferase involved in cell wall biosynthesis
VVLELAQSLGSAGLNVDILSTNANNGKDLDVSSRCWHQYPTHRIQYFRACHRGDQAFSLSLIQWLVRYLKNYDIVHTHTLFSPLLCSIHTLCRFYNIPYIMTPHGMLDPWPLAHKASKKRVFYNRLEKPALKHASAIQVLSSFENEQIRHLGHKNTVLVPNGIHASNFLSLPDPDVFYGEFPHLRIKRLILFLGRIDPKKGLDLLAPGFAQLHNAFPDTHLVIAGPDLIDFTPTVREYFSQLNCLDAVTFTGMLTGELKYAALAAASLYVAPSYSEGFSMSILEGMAAGLPCVFTEGCNFPEAKAAEAAYVVPADSQAIAEALLKAFRNPEQSQRIGANGQKLILDHYTWEKSAQSLATTYQQILAGS